MPPCPSRLACCCFSVEPQRFVRADGKWVVNSSTRDTAENPRFLALFGWALQKPPADEFLICAENPTISEQSATENGRTSDGARYAAKSAIIANGRRLRTRLIEKCRTIALATKCCRETNEHSRSTVVLRCTIASLLADSTVRAKLNAHFDICRSLPRQRRQKCRSDGVEECLSVASHRRALALPASIATQMMATVIMNSNQRGKISSGALKSICSSPLGLLCKGRL
jgi:hypothetical protein